MKDNDFYPIRLQAYMAKCGVGSRRACEELIREGHVMVNNKVVREMGVKVGPDDVVQVDTETIEPADKLYYIALNKPRGYVCTNFDPNEEKYARDLIGIRDNRLLFNVGRLDKDSNGLIIFTNDGDFANRMMHPKYEVEKEYIVKLDRDVSIDDLNRALDGIYIDMPRPYRIKRYDLIMVDSNSFIAVVMTDNSVVRNKIIRLPSDLNQPQLQLLNTLLNSSFVGLTLTEITPELMRVAQHAVGESYGLISLVVSFAMDVLQELESQSVHTAGLSSLFAHPEYQSIDKAQPLLEYLSEDMDPSQLPVPQTEQMKIIIGPENAVNELKDTSVVLASYDIGDNMRGVIGVVGPTRMDYAKVTARLAYFTDRLTRMFGKTDPSLPPPGGAGDPHKEE